MRKKPSNSLKSHYSVKQTHVAPPLRPHLYDHYDNGPCFDFGQDGKRWPDFSARELACSHCGEFYYDAVAFDILQRLGHRMGAPLIINSAHRCVQHNQWVGGRPNSAHLKIAFDIAIGSHDPPHLYEMARRVGFTNFGFYQTFLHVDLRPPVAGNHRRWVASGVDMSMWNPQ